MPRDRVAGLELAARNMVGDNGRPNVYFVSDGGAIITITTDKAVAYKQWLGLAARRPLAECALEDRQTGMLASVEPESDEPNARLVVVDDVEI